MSNTVALLLFTLLTLSSSVMVGSAFAQSIPTPSVPEFTLKLVDHSYDVPSYDVPPTYEIDQYTGENVTIAEGYHVEGYHVENKTIDITIINQPFVSPDEYTHFGYNVRVKGPFGENWKELYPYTVSQHIGPWNLRFQSASENTVISVPQDYPSGGTVEFQVEAVIAIGHPLPNTNFGYWEYLTSGWSSTQTITIPESSTPSPEPTSTPTPTEEPQPSEQDLTAGAVLAVTSIVVFLGLLFYFIKRG